MKFNTWIIGAHGRSRPATPFDREEDTFCGRVLPRLSGDYNLTILHEPGRDPVVLSGVRWDDFEEVFSRLDPADLKVFQAMQLGEGIEIEEDIDE